MLASNQLKPKTKAEVELVLTDGTSLRGSFFVAAQQRILDILNDDRAFLPFEGSDGVVTLLNKSAIARIKPIEQTVERAQAAPTFIGEPTRGG